MRLVAVLTCPACGHQVSEKMPVDACRHVYECPRCSATLRAEAGDCCVFCSYGDTACPPVQQRAADGS